MKDRYNPTRNEEQLQTMPTDYRTLLATTRPLWITGHTLPFWRGGQICRPGLGVPRESEDWCVESTLRKGQILRPGRSDLEIAGDEDLATRREEGVTSSSLEASDAATESEYSLPEDNSNLQIRIYLGMS